MAWSVLGITAFAWSAVYLVYRMCSGGWFLGRWGMPEPSPEVANPIELALIANGWYQPVTLASHLVILGCLAFMTYLVRDEMRCRNGLKNLLQKS